ncbi:SAM-dependent methyltransferase [Paenibacillus polysaccharolyticus]|uniref:SAM-dependent methyltransferase n=1 Tax=Paenibacillus polysaccharolyticus TaxID=582692 RepID=UPI0030B8F543
MSREEQRIVNDQQSREEREHSEDIIRDRKRSKQMHQHEESGLELSQIVFIGRTFEEYMLMFDLTREELAGQNILDCPGGACSFSGQARKLGAHAVASDIVYQYGMNELGTKGFQDIEHTMKQIQAVQGMYVWDHFGTIEGLRQERLRAITDCVKDMREHPECYVATVLPELPFNDEQFDLTLSAHFLFTYADRLNFDFHVRTLLEMLRVTKHEVRIFPTVDLTGKRYEHMDELKVFLEKMGYLLSEVRTSYEFQRNAHTMLRIRKPSL